MHVWIVLLSISISICMITIATIDVNTRPVSISISNDETHDIDERAAISPIRLRVSISVSSIVLSLIPGYSISTDIFFKIRIDIDTMNSMLLSILG